MDEIQHQPRVGNPNESRTCLFPCLNDISQSHSSFSTIPVPFDAVTLHIFCQAAGLRPAQVIQGVWAVVLRVYTSDDSVAYAYQCGTEVSRCSVDVAEDCTLGSIVSGIRYQTGLLDADADTTVDTLVTEDGQPPLQRFKVILNIHNASELSLGYHSSTLSHEQAVILSRVITQAISQFIDTPSLSLKDINLLTPDDISLLSQWNPLPPSTSATVLDLIQHQCSAHPDAIAVCAWDGSITYRDLKHLSDRLAGYLVSLDIQGESFIPLYFDKSKWTTLAILGVIKAGAAFILLDPALPTQRLREMCDRVCATTVLCSEHLVSKAATLASTVVPITDGPSDWVNYTPASSVDSRPTVTPENTLYAVFTSGSTGKPKCAVIPHSSYAAAALAHISLAGLDTSSRVFQFASYAFDSSVYENLSVLIAGGCICVPLASEIRDNLTTAIRSFNANWVFLTPTVARLLRPEDLPSLQTLILGGEAVTQSDIQQWMGHLRLKIGYGPSECTPCTAIHPHIEGSQDAHLIGTPAGAACWVIHPDDPNRLMPIGAPGELLIEGPIVGRGYLGDTQRTNASFIDPPPWLSTFRGSVSGKLYRTGDLVQNTTRGRIRYIGRKDAQVKLNGQRVELQEVQFVVRDCFENAQDVFAEVITPADEGSRPTLMAFIVQHGARPVVNPSDEIDIIGSASRNFQHQTEAAVDKIRRRLPRYMVPTTFLPLSTLPVTPSGKIDRKQLRWRASAMSRQQLASYSDIQTDQIPPSTEKEHRLHHLVQEVLGVSGIGMEANFFHLGGDSISAMTLVARSRREGLSLRVEDIFRWPRLLDLAQGIRERSIQTNMQVIVPFALLSDGISRDAAIYEAQRQCGVLAEEIEDIYPCTALQEGMMALTTTNHDMYVSRAVFQLPTGIDMDRLKMAWEKTIQNNMILRTRIIHAESGQALQVVVRSGIPWESFEDLQSNHGWFGMGDPLIRMAVGLKDGNKALMICIHHALYDGWSFPLILEQVENAYHGQELTYRSFAPFLSYLVDGDQQKMEDFWRTQMKDVTVSSFPGTTSSSQRTVASQCIITRSIALPARHIQNTTLATAIRLAWALTIARYTGSWDVVMGVTMAGRNVPIDGIEDITGPTITTMPVRVNVDPSCTVEDMLVHLQHQAMKSIPVEHMGLQKLKTLGADCAGASKFQNLLVVQPQSKPFPGIMGTLVEGGFIVRLHSYDFVLECDLGDDVVTAKANFDSNALTADRARRILDHFSNILTRIHSNPSSSLSTVLSISPEDMSQLQRWNETLPDAVDLCVQDIILRHTLAHPDAPAVCSWDGDLSYIDLDQLSSKVATYLRRRHVRPESIVPLYFHKSKWTIVAMLGVMKAGGAFVLLDPSHPDKRIESIFRQVHATVLLTSSGSKSSLPQFHGMDVVAIEEAAYRPEWSDDGDIGCSMPSVQSCNAVYVVFTSGSTGTPKGTVIEHGAFTTNALYGLPSQVLDSSSRVLQFASYAFDASIAEMLFTLTSGGCVCIPQENDRMTNIVECINSMAVTHLYLTPSVARSLDPSHFTTLKTLMLCGEAMKAGDIAMWADSVRLVNAYGPSECCIASVQQLHVTSTSHPANIGTSCSASSWIVDPNDHDTLLPIGATGELLIEGPIVGRGYMNEPDKTSAVFIDPPSWLRDLRGDRPTRVYKTGDLVQYSMQMDGSMQYVGRKDNQVKLRGQRIELGEIEHQIMQCVDIKDVLVELVTPDNNQHPMLVAFLWVEENETDDDELFGPATPTFQSLARKISTDLQDRLPSYMIPSRFLPLRRIPQTNTGKADRKRLRAFAAALSPEQMRSFQSIKPKTRQIPLTETEQTLQQLVGDILHLPSEEIYLDSNFFQLGGDSLTAMRLVSRLKKCSWQVRVTDVYKQPVLAQLAQRCDEVGIGDR